MSRAAPESGVRPGPRCPARQGVAPTRPAGEASCGPGRPHRFLGRGRRVLGRRRERGAATVLAVALAGVLMLVGVATVWLAGLVVAHRRAQAAADLAALAAASAGQHGHSACGAAGEVATANEASVSSCRVAGDDAWVVVGVEAPRLLGLRPRVSARAHAGPAP